MRKSFTAVLEQGSVFTESFATEPYEVAWATEARCFIHVLELSGELTLDPEISPDGLVWCPEGGTSLSITKPGLFSLALRDFGHWLRLDARLSGQMPQVKLIIYLALKE